MQMFSKSPNTRSHRVLAAIALGCCTLSLPILAFTAAPSAIARSAAEDLPAGEKIVDKYIESTGGKDAYAKIKSRTVEGTFGIPKQGISGAMTSVAANNSILTTIDLTGIGKIEQGYNGDAKIGWEKNAVQGTRLLQGEELDQVRQQATIGSEINWRDDYASAKTTGVENVGGKDCYKVEMTKKKGNRVETRLYNKETGLLEVMRTSAETPQGTFPLEATLSDYREVDGVKVPFKTSQKVTAGAMDQTIEIGITSMKANTDIPAATFNVPDDVKKMAEEAKAGGGEKKDAPTKDK